MPRRRRSTEPGWAYRADDQLALQELIIQASKLLAQEEKDVLGPTLIKELWELKHTNPWIPLGTRSEPQGPALLDLVMAADPVVQAAHSAFRDACIAVVAVAGALFEPICPGMRRREWDAQHVYLCTSCLPQARKAFEGASDCDLLRGLDFSSDG